MYESDVISGHQIPVEFIYIAILKKRAKVLHKNYNRIS